MHGVKSKKMKVIPQREFKKLIIGKEYVVLGIEADSYRILNEEGCPYLYGPSGFEVIDKSNPKYWVCETGEDDEMYCYPKEWNRPGFFEDYFDNVQEARKVFDEVLAKEYTP